jgi:flagellar motor switch protein FliN
MALTPGEPMVDQARWLMEQWTAALAAAIESMTEQRPEVEFAASGEDGETAAEPGAAALCWEQGFQDIPQPALWVTAPEKTWLELGGRTLRAAGIDAAEASDARNTYLEILSQSLASVAQALGARLGKEVAAERGAERKQAGPTAHRFQATLRYPDVALELEASLSAVLMKAIEIGALGSGAAPGDSPAETVRRSSAAGSGASVAAESASASASSRTMDVLLDVELPVSVSFGRTQLPIKEVLKLTTGSIVELDRSLTEPVDVIVNNCVVARGEVVVIEGNYGVRIHEIMSRQDRLRSLR